MISEQFDLAVIAIYAFWLFFAGLIFYLRREDRREGYPLEMETPGTYKDSGVIWIPEPKSFNMADGTTVHAPSADGADLRPVAGTPTEPWTGAPLEPTGDNPMLDCIGPSAYADRADVPDVTDHGAMKIVPLRTLPDFHIVDRDPDPRGYSVVGSDGAVGGTVADVWIDVAEVMIRYLEVETGTGDTKKNVLLPMTLAKVHRGRGEVEASSVLGAQIAGAPVTRSADEVTLLEEDKISAYFGSGFFYSRPENREPLL